MILMMMMKEEKLLLEIVEILVVLVCVVRREIVRGCRGQQGGEVRQVRQGWREKRRDQSRLVGLGVVEEG